MQLRKTSRFIGHFEKRRGDPYAPLSKRRPTHSHPPGEHQVTFQSQCPSCRRGPGYLHPKKQSEDSARLCQMSGVFQLSICIFTQQAIMKTRPCSRYFDQHRRGDLKVDRGISLLSRGKLSNGEKKQSFVGSEREL